MPSNDSSAGMPAPCRDCNVRQVGMCAVLTLAELRTFAENARRSTHEPGDHLMLEDSELTSYANGTGGIVKLSRVMRDGRQQLVGLHFAPDLLGRLFGTENKVTVEAASPVDICRVPKHVLEALVSSSPELKQRLLDQSLQDLDEARDWMVTLGRKDAQQRVASLMMLIARRNGVEEIDGGRGAAFDLPLTRADMADLLALTVETVCRQISRLRKDGVVGIRNHRHVTVPDMSRLSARAG